LSGEDNKYLYFTAKTSGFSSFAITGTVKSFEGTQTGIQIASPEIIKVALAHPAASNWVCSHHRSKFR